MGILKAAPAEVFIASALIGALPWVGIIIPSTPVHSAVRIIAPKLRTSLIWSNSRKRGILFWFKTVSINSSRSEKEMEDIFATAPWWFWFLASLFSFSTGSVKNTYAINYLCKLKT